MNFFTKEDLKIDDGMDLYGGWMTGPILEWANRTLEEKLKKRTLVIAQEYTKYQNSTVNNLPEQRRLNEEFFGTPFPYGKRDVTIS